jgi:hypothetical protein
MAISRKEALKQLRGLWPRVQRHLAKLAARPNDREVPHWKKETRNWLREMEEYLPHVGKKTAAEWQARLDSCRAALGA